MKPKDIDQLGSLIDDAKTVLILQPDKPDGDSLGSAMALEDVLGELGKQTHLYTAGRVEEYLQYVPGYDRVSNDWPDSYDLAILVDTGSPTSAPRLLEQHHAQLKRKPWVSIDHHADRTQMDGTVLELIDPTAAATSQILWEIGQRLKWKFTPEACAYLVMSLYADTLNLTVSSVTPRTIAAFSGMVTTGDLQVSKLHAAFRDSAALDADLLKVKGELLQNMELHSGGKIAICVISEQVLKEYRDRVNPSILVMPDMLWARGVQVAATISVYPNIVRTSLRSRVPVAGKVATNFGGGGHANAAAFPSEGKELAEIKVDLIKALTEALEEQS